MSYNKRTLADHFNQLLNNCTEDPERLDKQNHYTILGGCGTRIELMAEDGRRFTGEQPNDGTPTIFILDDGVNAMNAFVSEALKDSELAARVGGSAISKRLEQLIRENYPFSDKSKSTEEIVKNDIVQFLRASIKKWNVLVPIRNLRMARPFIVGNVRFIGQDQGVVSSTRAVMSIEGPPDPSRNNSDKATFLKLISDISRQGGTWAAVTIESHESRVKDVAKDEVETAINVVRAFTHVFTSRSVQAAFGMPYEFNGGMIGVIADGGEGVNVHFDRRGSYSKFEVDENVLNRLEAEFCLSTLSRIAGSSWEELNSFERALRVAVVWVGRSIVSLSIAEAFTKCAIALERILVVDGEETTTETLADRSAYLISDDVHERMHIHKAMKRLYEIRSKVVHSGFDFVETYQLQEIENLAVMAIRRAAQLVSSIPNHEALREVLHTRKME